MIIRPYTDSDLERMNGCAPHRGDGSMSRKAERARIKGTTQRAWLLTAALA